MRSRGWSEAPSRPEQPYTCDSETPPMGPCPSVEHLRRLLADELTATEEKRLDDHLGRCGACRRGLESLTAPEPASGRPGAAGGPAPRPEWLHRLKTVAASLSGDGRGGAVPPAEPR